MLGERSNPLHHQGDLEKNKKTYLIYKVWNKCKILWAMISDLTNLHISSSNRYDRCRPTSHVLITANTGGMKRFVDFDNGVTTFNIHATILSDLKPAMA